MNTLILKLVSYRFILSNTYNSYKIYNTSVSSSLFGGLKLAKACLVLALKLNIVRVKGDTIIVFF